MPAEQRTEAFAVATDDLIASLIERAERRLVVVAPAVSSRVAQAICRRWERMAADAVTVVLDSDPEVYRLGYGDFPALQQLTAAAQEHGAGLRRQPGLRIGIVIADEETVIYVPTARLIEAGPNTHSGSNAICLRRPPATVETDLGLTPDAVRQVGRAAMERADIQQVGDDLQKNPPQQFDLARKMKVFNSFIEFVELEVLGTSLFRRTVTIPSYLLAITNKKTQRQLQARFQLVSADDELSGKELTRYRGLITAPYLHSISPFGTVVLRRDKEKLEAAVAKLSAEVTKFATMVEETMQQQIESNVDELVRSFLPALAKRPPKEWYSPSGERPPRDQVEDLLRRDLKEAFGCARDLVDDMNVKCMFKGVTYELLKDPAFHKAATAALPELRQLYREFEAVEGTAVAGQPVV